jgi:Family of unknown function (DUF5335)
MTSRTLPKEEWHTYCDRISKGLAGHRAHIEVAGLAIGDQVAAKWLPLFGITYDAKNDFLEIAMEGLDHLVHKKIARVRGAVDAVVKPRPPRPP